ncbi:MAG: hypothetical protein M1130_05805 [Actinobacteria bacterium]|nr:hypothetical protein [Actinomycetota bacterium]
MFKMSFFDPEFSTSKAAQGNPLSDMGIFNGLFVPLDMLKSPGGTAVTEKKERHLRLVENKGADSEKNQKETIYYKSYPEILQAQEKVTPQCRPAGGLRRAVGLRRNT